MTHATGMELHDTVPSIADAFIQQGFIGVITGGLILALIYGFKEIRAINEMHNERHDKRNQLTTNDAKRGVTEPTSGIIQWSQVFLAKKKVTKNCTQL